MSAHCRREPQLDANHTVHKKRRHLLTDIANTGCNGVGVDWTTDLQEARTLTDDRVALQGNMDPGVLYGSKETIRAEVQRVLESYGTGGRHIFNLATASISMSTRTMCRLWWKHCTS